MKGRHAAHQGAAHPRQRDHGSKQDHAIEPAMPGIGRAQENRRAHGMRQCEDRRRAVRQHDVVDEGFEVDLVLREIAHIALAPVAQLWAIHTVERPHVADDGVTPRVCGVGMPGIRYVHISWYYVLMYRTSAKGLRKP